MWVSSFVVTLPDDQSRIRAICDAIAAIPVFEVGDLIGTQLPVVLEVENGSSARYWHRWVEDLPGVVHVNVAFVNFEEFESVSASTSEAEDRIRPAAGAPQTTLNYQLAGTNYMICHLNEEQH